MPCLFVEMGEATGVCCPPVATFTTPGICVFVPFDVAVDAGRGVAVAGRVDVAVGVVALVGLGEGAGVVVPLGVRDGPSVSVSSIGAWALIVVPVADWLPALACAGVAYK